MRATLGTMTHGPTAADLHGGQTMVVNGHVVAIDYTRGPADGLVTIEGHEGAIHRSFRLDATDPVTIIG